MSRRRTVGDSVRVLTGEFAGEVGTITRPANPDSPWAWVVSGPGWEGPGHRWITAVNDDEIEAADA